MARKSKIKNMDTQGTRELTAGEVAVGLTFNPSGDERVAKLKALFAEAFDIVEQSVPADDGTVLKIRPLIELITMEITN